MSAKGEKRMAQGKAGGNGDGIEVKPICDQLASGEGSISRDKFSFRINGEIFWVRLATFRGVKVSPNSQLVRLVNEIARQFGIKGGDDATSPYKVGQVRQLLGNHRQQMAIIARLDEHDQRRFDIEVGQSKSSMDMAMLANFPNAYPPKD